MDGMVSKLEILAVIPARGGSKGIPRKNIKPFAGYPLIAYSIEAGLRAKLVTRVIVSTDDKEIASVARQYGAQVPFLRPSELAQDDTRDLPVFQQALDWLDETEDYRPEMVVQLRPTSPIRPWGSVDEALQMLIDNPEVDSVRGVVPAGQNPHKMWRIDPETRLMSPLLEVKGIDEPFNAPRQALPQIYWQTGHIDAIRAAVITRKQSMSGTRILPLILDPRYTVDIDTPFDWKRYEWLVMNSDLDMVDPAKKRRSFPEKISLLVMDFDGVLTDNRVWVDEDGKERVASNRSDSLGLSILRQKTGIEPIVISKETNPVVTARCKKLRINAYQSVDEKADLLKKILEEKNLPASEAIYIGNDINDLVCFPLVGFAVAPSDAQPEVLRSADLVLDHPGGHGAVRELCDLILSHQAEK